MSELMRAQRHGDLLYTRPTQRPLAHGDHLATFFTVRAADRCGVDYDIPATVTTPSLTD